MKRILAQSALALLLTAAGAIAAISAANAAPQSGIYHQEVLPNGTVTGPIGPQVNGG